MRKPYTIQQKLEAVALGRVIGSDAAGKQLGIDPRTIVKWMSKAGDAPELAGNPGQWQRLLDLAHARTEAALASGKLSAIQVATIAGIAQRNVAKPVISPPESAVAAREAYFDWLSETMASRMTEADLTSDADIDAVSDAMSATQRELLRRANAEGHPDRQERPEAEGPHRPAMLAWFSGREEVEAGDVLEWAEAQITNVLADHGTLTAWHAASKFEEEARRAAVDIQLERNRQAALEWTTRALDDETLTLLAEAEAWLAAHAEPAP